MFGNCETGKVAIATAPTITVRIAMTIATIGRLMKKFDTFVSPVFDKRFCYSPDFAAWRASFGLTCIPGDTF